MTVLLAIAFSVAAECGPLALAADDCTREALIWAEALAATSVEWAVTVWPETA